MKIDNNLIYIMGLCNLFIFAGFWLILKGVNSYGWIIGIISILFGEINLMIYIQNKERRKKK
jgi:hypothetical protein